MTTTFDTREALDTAVETAVTAANAYYHGAADALMSDTEYDFMVEKIGATIQANPDWETPASHGLLNSVAGGTTDALADVPHAIPMLSLAKVTVAEDVDAFVTKVKALNGNVVVEPKLDGSAMSLEFVHGHLHRAVTRGDGAMGKDVTAQVKALDIDGIPSNLPETFNAVVKGEVYMTVTQFEKATAARDAHAREEIRERLEARAARGLNTDALQGKLDAPEGEYGFANSRNAIAGMVNRDDPVEYHVSASFAAYDIVLADGEPESTYSATLDATERLGIATARSLLYSAGVVEQGATQTAHEVIEALKTARSALPYPIDGAVVKADEVSVREEMGVGSRHPRWAVAYKYDAEQGISVLRSIERAVGRTGNLSYTAIFDPVVVDGSKIARASVHNADQIAIKDLRIGDTIVVQKANDIIPEVVEVVLSERPSDATAYVPPTTCPTCSEELDRSGVVWRCLNPSCSLQYGVAYAVSRDCLDVDGFSTAIANALVDSGKVSKMADIFSLTLEDFETLTLNGRRLVNDSSIANDRDNTIAARIYKSLQESKSQPLARIICALGIRGTGRSMSRNLASHFETMEALQAASINDLYALDLIGHDKATLIHNGLRLAKPNIDAMRAAGVNMGTATQKDATPKPLTGKKVVVTGSMKGSALEGKSRNVMNELIEEHGGKSSSSVSSSTSILVCGEEGSSKWKKAKELNVTIMTPTEFATLLGI